MAEPPEPSGSDGSQKRQRVIDALRGELDNVRAKPAPSSSICSGGKSKGKGKGKAKSSTVSRMPHELIGMASRRVRTT